MNTNILDFQKKALEMLKEQKQILDFFQQQQSEHLNWSPAEGTWSALACIEHLLKYVDYYIPQLENLPNSTKKLDKLRYTALGKFSIRMVDPENTKTYTALKSMRPTQTTIDKGRITLLLNTVKQMYSWLEGVDRIDVNKRCIKISFFPLIKMRWAESMYFMINHQQRHLLQAKRVLSQATTAS